MDDSSKVSVQLNVTNIVEAIEKAERLVTLLKEAKSLADELATVDMKLLGEIDKTTNDKKPALTIEQKKFLDDTVDALNKYINITLKNFSKR